MTWTKIGHVARYEFVTTLQRRSARFVIFGLPLLTLALLLGLNWLARQSGGGQGGPTLLTQIAGSQQERQPVGLVDLSGLASPLPEPFGGTFTPFASEEAARAAVAAGTVNGFYTLPAGLLDGEEIRYTAQRPGVDLPQESALYSLLARQLVPDQALADRLYVPAMVQVTDLSAIEESGPRDYLGAMALGMGVSILFYLTAMSASGYLLQSLGAEKQNRVIELLLSSLRPAELLAGKILGLGGIGLVQLLVWGALGSFITGAGNNLLGNLSLPALSPSIWALVLLHFLLGFLVYASLFAGLGAIAPNPKESGQVTFFIMLPTFLPMWFISVLLQAPNGTAAFAMSLVPLTSPIAMPVRLVLTAVPAWQWLASLALEGLAAAGTLWLAARIFHSRTLLSGQSLSGRAIWQAVRGR